MSGSKSSDDASAASKPPEHERRGITLPEEGAVAMAAVLHLLRLVSAELVLFRGVDVQRFEKAMREKISEFTSPIANQERERSWAGVCALFGRPGIGADSSTG